MLKEESIQENPKGCWRVCAGAALMMFCIAGLTINAFSIYLPYLRETCHLTNTQNSNVLQVRSLFSILSLFFVGIYYQKLEIRLGAALAMLMSVGSMVLYAVSDSFGGLCAAAAFAGLANGLGGMYPASLLIHRWFSRHGSVALGICTASTGMATIIGAPVCTFLIEHFSLAFSLLAEASLLLTCTVAAFLLIRSDPAGRAPLAHPVRKKYTLHLNWMFAAIVAASCFGSTGFQYISMHYSTLGLDSYRVSALVSVLGLSLSVSKFLFGESVDRLGAYRSNWLFFGSIILGGILHSVGSGYGVAMTAVVLFGLGMAVTTVGQTVYATDLSRPEEFEETVQQYQIAYYVGALLFGSVPGILADWTGNYRLFYVLVTVLSVFSLTVIQCSYRKVRAGSGKTE